jgi:hypothetical protein
MAGDFDFENGIGKLLWAWKKIYKMKNFDIWSSIDNITKKKIDKFSEKIKLI